MSYFSKELREIVKEEVALAMKEVIKDLRNGTIDETPFVPNKQQFDYCHDFREGFAAVKLNGKWNFINKEGNLLSEKWFDDCFGFNEGFARVKLNNKWNYLDKGGKFLSDQWFDDCGYFNKGYASVKLDGKYNYINQEGKLLSSQWFDYLDDFK